MRQAIIETQDDEDLYPSSDGKPLGETDYHVLAIILILQAIEDLTRDVETVHVASNLFLYYEEGNPKARKAPDVMVTLGVKRGLRRTFKTWVEKAVPNAVFEVTSRKTKKQDLVIKPEIYARIGIKEYYLFDPEATYLKPCFQGFRLKSGRYEPLSPEADGGLTTQELPAHMIPEGHLLRFIDLRTGKPVPTRREVWEQAEREKQRADALEAVVSRLKAKLAKNGK
jgi:Uma2 family endonuclease